MAIRILSRGIFCAHGRLTLTTAVPVLTSDVSGADTIRYTPYVGNLISLYSGSEFLAYHFAELSHALSDDTKSPAVAGNDSIYDMFVWLDGGTLRLSRGPAWSSDTARGTGAGTTELERVNGVWLNKVAIANGPAAQRGTYVGTIRTNPAAATVPFVMGPAAAAGGTDNRLYVWNAYNRVPVTAICRDSVDTWTYTTATARPFDNDEGGAGTNTKNRISFLIGLAEGRVQAEANLGVRNSAVDTVLVGAIGFDSTSAMAAGCLPDRLSQERASCWLMLRPTFSRMAEIGKHYVQALEYSQAAGTTTWAGDGGGGSLIQSGLTLDLEM